MINGNTPVDYSYLNMDTHQFVDSQEELVEQIGPSATLRVATNDLGQVLIGGGNEYFTEGAMIVTCRRISGVLPGGKVVE